MKCPSCGSQDVLFESNTAYGIDILYHYCQCQSCSLEWEEKYNPFKTEGENDGKITLHTDTRRS